MQRRLRDVLKRSMSQMAERSSTRAYWVGRQRAEAEASNRLAVSPHAEIGETSLRRAFVVHINPQKQTKKMTCLSAGLQRLGGRQPSSCGPVGAACQRLR